MKKLLLCGLLEKAAVTAEIKKNELITVHNTAIREDQTTQYIDS